MKKLIALMSVLAAAALGDTPWYPRIDTTTDQSTRPSRKSITVREAATWRLGFRYLRGTSAVNFVTVTNTAAITLTYAPDTDPAPWSVQATGTWETPTNGWCYVDLTPAQLATNGTFRFDVRIASGSTVHAATYGELVILSQVGGGAITTNHFPTNGVKIGRAHV